MKRTKAKVRLIRHAYAPGEVIASAASGIIAAFVMITVAGQRKL